jgi:hypothetical protein
MGSGPIGLAFAHGCYPADRDAPLLLQLLSRHSARSSISRERRPALRTSPAPSLGRKRDRSRPVARRSELALGRQVMVTRECGLSERGWLALAAAPRQVAVGITQTRTQTLTRRGQPSADVSDAGAERHRCQDGGLLEERWSQTRRREPALGGCDPTETQQTA